MLQGLFKPPLPVAKFERTPLRNKALTTQAQLCHLLATHWRVRRWTHIRLPVFVCVLRTYFFPSRAVCGGNISEPQGVLQDNDVLDSELRCSWHIYSDRRMPLKITLESINLPSDGGACRETFIQVSTLPTTSLHSSAFSCPPQDRRFSDMHFPNHAFHFSLAYSCLIHFLTLVRETGLSAVFYGHVSKEDIFLCSLFFTLPA